jgi:hypothetical protein
LAGKQCLGLELTSSTTHAAVDWAVCRYKGKIQVHYMCPGDSPTNTVLQLVASSSNSPQELADDVWNTVGV